MKIIATVLLAVSVGLVLAGQADAASRQKKRHTGESASGAYGYRDSRQGDRGDGYYEHRLEAVPFGSPQWWHIYGEQKASLD